MSTHRVLLLSASICAAIAPACGGRSGLDDFSNGANNIIVSPGGGASSDEPDAGNGVSAPDAAPDAEPDAGEVIDQPGPAAKGEIGAKCDRDRQCNDGDATCLQQVDIRGAFQIDFPGGYCAIEGCTDDSDCPTGAGCLSSFGLQTCLQLCESDDDCRAKDDYACNSVDPRGGSTYCLPNFGGGQGMGGGGFGGN